ncbi:Glycosyltransferase AER61 [Cinnamomum micranthum f. kanehirae]|uniref:Glycosyltransferase AER61 n=1 Tax=Cinnamomum micranthum f. kanehirae TaxID=337451 RepID=A0A3S3R3G3_9MAGN|nr:Glycosyltransferase AER61 [Cinnamomum micranthum f. kanehirae]
MAKSLGYKVVIPDLDFGVSFTKISQIVNSCDVLMGVHGAGLTNVFFLPTNAVLIQVLPLGETEWVAGNCYGEPSVNMKIRGKESTLTEHYPHDDTVQLMKRGTKPSVDPVSAGKRGWDVFWSIYLEKQSVKLDVGRFRDTLLKALELLHN